jgi:hypothetical protein
MITAYPNRHFRSGFFMHARDPIDLPNVSDLSRDGQSFGADNTARARGRRF